MLPHYDTARRMLGVTPNPQFTPADEMMQAIAREVGSEDTFRPTEVGVLFADEGSKPGDPGARPLLRRSGSRAPHLQLLRGVHGRLPGERQEHPDEELPVLRREMGGGDPRRG